MYILLAILVFGILIAVHELGHFLVAKACGVRVDDFAIGMGPAIWKKQKGETLYAVRCLPIGGYCAMAGEDEATDDPRAFTSQPAWKRFLILCAGAFMNFVFGLLLLLIVFAQAKSFSTPTLTDFMDGCPYQGEDALQVGDTIWSIDGHRIYFTTNVSEYLARGGDTHDIVVKRGGEKVALNDFYLVAREYPGQDGKMYGFYFGTKPATFGAKLQTTWYSAMDFVRMVWMGLSDLLAGAVGVKDLSGPVGIVSMMNEVGKESATKAAAFSNIAYFSAFIAVNLAVMNMLPLPALDGGRVFCLLVTWVLERISRRKIDPKYEGYIHTAGLVLLLALMAYVMYNDISKLVT